MGILLLALVSTQAGVFEDRETGFRLPVPLGWELVFAGDDGRVVLTRAEDPSFFVRAELVAGVNEHLAARNWKAYLDQFTATMKARLPDYVLGKHASSTADDLACLEIWAVAGKEQEAVASYIRTLAGAERTLVLSASVKQARWEELRESTEATLRAADFRKAEPGARAAWVDAANGFSIAIPAGHRLRPLKRGNTVLNVFAPGGVTNLNVVVQPPEPAFEKLSAKDLRTELEGKLKSLKGFAFTEFEKIAWNRRAAVKTAAVLQAGESKIANLQFGVSAGKRSYYLTWSTLQDRYAKERPDFEASLQTFALLEE